MNELILDKLDKLPEQAKVQAIDYIEYLLQKYSNKTPNLEVDTIYKDRVEIARAFKGAAKYPNIKTSESEWYEQ